MPLTGTWCPEWLSWHHVGAAIEQILPRAGLLLISIAPLSAALHWLARSALLPYLVQCLAI